MPLCDARGSISPYETKKVAIACASSQIGITLSSPKLEIAPSPFSVPRHAHRRPQAAAGHHGPPGRLGNPMSSYQRTRETPPIRASTSVEEALRTRLPLRWTLPGQRCDGGAGCCRCGDGGGAVGGGRQQLAAPHLHADHRVRASAMLRST